MPLEEFNSDEISYEVSYEIRYYVIKHRRKKYQKTCRCPDPIVRAPAPVKLFDKGLYSTEFWIKVLIDKYAHGIPLMRQIEIMQMEQFSIAKSSLCNGLWKISDYLEPLYELMLEKIAFEPLIHADETRWRNWAASYMSHRADEKSLHWLWGFFSELLHVFVIDPTRSAQVIKDIFGQGEFQTVAPIFVTDRYKAYISACKILAFCWAHVRRDFLSLQIKYPYDKELFNWAQTYLDLISDLYALNAQRLNFQEGSEHFIAFQQQLQIVIDKMHVINIAAYKDSRKKKQAESMVNHWKGLTLFLELPEIPLDNNLAERQLRKPVIGRKSFYGTHSDKATKATAIFYSIIATCKLHSVNPIKFLKRYLSFCAHHKKPPPRSMLIDSFFLNNYAKKFPEDGL